MNEILFYCEQCGFRIPPQDLASGSAKPLENNRALCCNCHSKPKRPPALNEEKLRESSTVVRLVKSRATPAGTGIEAAHSAGHLARATPGPGTVEVPAGPAGSPKVARNTSHNLVAHARAAKARESSAATIYLYVGGAMLAVALLVGVIAAASWGPRDTHSTPVQTASSAPETGTSTIPPKVPVTPTSPVPVGPTTGTTTTTVTGSSNEPADRALDRAQAYAKEYPADSDGYYYELLRVMREFPGSRAATQAEELQKGLLLPLEGRAPPTPEWYEAWTFIPDRQNIEARFKLDDRYAVLVTRPPKPKQNLVLRHRLKVDAVVPILEFDVRGDAGQRWEGGLALDGRNLLRLDVNGPSWQRVSVDCSTQAGREIDIVLIQQPGAKGTEPAYWTPPRWQAKPSLRALTAALPGPDERPIPALPTEEAWAKAIDLLARSKPEEDAVDGPWNRAGAEVVSPMMPYARLALPYRPPEEYDLRARFTRRDGVNSVVLFLARGATCFIAQFSGWETLGGIEQVGGRSSQGNSTTVPCVLENGRAYTAVVQVRREGLWVYLDGKLFTQLATDYSDLSSSDKWTLESRQGQMGLGAYNSEYVFQSVQLIEVSGPGLPLRDEAGATIEAPAAPQVVDLLPVVDFTGDRIDGDWTKKDGELHVAGNKERARLILPYVPPESYDFIVSLTMPESQGQFCQAFSQGNHTLAFMAITDNPEMIRCGYETFDGKSVSDGPTLCLGKPLLRTGQRYTLVTQVRKDGLRTLVNGERLLAYQTDFANAAMHDKWSTGEKGLGRLGLGVMKADYIFHEARVVEISGRGRIERAPGTPTTPTTPPTTPALAADNAARQAWAVFLDEAMQYVQAGKNEVLLKRVSDALAAPDLQPLKADLEKDATLLRFVSDLRQATLAGLALLPDGRPFTIERTKGDPLKVGKDSPNRILKVNGEECDVEQEVGGGKLGVKMYLNEFTRDTHLKLAQLVLTEKPGDQIKLMVAEVARLVPGAPDDQVAALNRRLDEIAQAEAQAPLVQRLRTWMTQKDREAKFEAACAELQNVIGQGKCEPAKKALEELKKSFFETAAYAGAGIRLEELEKGIKALELKPGLWAMYYNKKGNSHYGELKVTEVISKLAMEYKKGSPAKGVGGDNFGVRLRGLLLIAKEGTYVFEIAGDDYADLWIDGKRVCEGGGKPQTGSVELKPGQHPFGFNHRENGGDSSWYIKWRKPGDANFAVIPPTVLHHNPSKTADYEKQ